MGIDIANGLGAALLATGADASLDADGALVRAGLLLSLRLLQRLLGGAA